MLGIAILAGAGVARSAADAAAAALMFLLGPLAALAALQLAVLVSSRVNDARSAQQMGALIILPMAGLLVAAADGRASSLTARDAAR